MPPHGEHKAGQTRILACVQEASRQFTPWAEYQTKMRRIAQP
jgi:hypothetical protein